MTQEPQPSSSSEVTEAGKPWPEVALLGDRIVHELGLAESSNTLGRWMSHYLAELLERAEQASTPREAEATKAECADLIFKLWSAHPTWPSGAPLARVLPVLAAMVERPIRYVRVPAEPPTSWEGLMEELEQMHTCEETVCHEGIVLAIPEDDLKEELERCERFREDLSDEERRFADLLKPLYQRLHEAPELQGLSVDEKQVILQKRLRQIADERNSLLARAELLSPSQAHTLDNDFDE